MAMFAINLFIAASNQCTNGTTLFPTLWKDLCKSGEVQFSSLEDSLIVIRNAVALLLNLAGIIAVIIIVAASIYYITSAGDAGRVKKAKDMVVNSVVGLVIVITARAVIAFITGGIG